MRRAAGGLAAALTLLLAPGAAAAPPCAEVPAKRVLVEGRGTLESVIIDRKGRLYFTDAGNGQLLRMDRRRSEPRVVVDGIDAPGGLTFLEDGSLLVGFGDGIVNGATGTLAPNAGLIRYDPRTGEHSVYAKGLTMANGVVRGPDGAIYASNDLGFGVDRVLNGSVERLWARLFSSNGLVIDTTGRYLFAAQTFQPAAIARIDLANPRSIQTWFLAPLGDIAAGLDGLTRDEHDNLYVAANLGGEVWRVAADASTHCSLAKLAPLGPSDVAFGRGKKRFSRRHLYVTTFQGELIQLKNVR